MFRNDNRMHAGLTFQIALLFVLQVVELNELFESPGRMLILGEMTDLLTVTRIQLLLIHDDGQFEAGQNILRA